MKRKSPSSSCSSSSSSSCIESPISESDVVTKKPLKSSKINNKPRRKRVRAKKLQNNTTNAAAVDQSATSSKSRSSIYRGVTRHRWTGRYEAHLWDKTTWNSIQNKRGRQIYLGAYDNEEDAARTYDLAALKYWGPASILNFPLETYGKEVEEMEKLTKEEYLASLRRRSSGFSRGVSKYRGVARHHHNGRWEARIGRVCGNKYLYLGTYSTQEEAAAAYDMAAIEFRGPNAVTNFDISNYANKLNKPILPPDQPQARIQEDGDQVLQVKQELNPTLLTKVQVEEAQYHHHDQLDHQQGKEEHDVNQVFQTISIPKLESSIGGVVMDPAEEHEHPWDHLCLETGFSMLPIPDDIPLDKTSEVFDYKGFEDDIECIFDGPLGDNEVLIHDAMSTTTSVCSNV